MPQACLRHRGRGKGGASFPGQLGAFTAVTLALASGLFAQQGVAAEPPRPPVAERRPVTVEHHGIRRTDEYGWLRTAKPDALLQHPESLEPAIRRYIDAENRYARQMLAPNRALERRMIAEMRGRIAERDAGVPRPYGPWEYYARFEKGAQRKLHCRRPRGGGGEQVILDENRLAQGRRAYSVDDTEISPDHKLLAYAFDADGSERNTVKVRDLATGRDLADSIADVRGGAVWSSDSQWLFYVRRDAEKWGRQIYRHRLGTPVAQDQLVYEEAEEGFTVGLRESLSSRFLIIEAGDFSTTELRLLDLSQPDSTPRPVTARKAGHRYAVSHLGDRLIFMTNADGAIDWKIAEKALTAPANAPLSEIVPHRPGRVIEDVIAYRDHLVWLERDRERGSQQIIVRRWSDGAEHAVSFGEAPAKVEVTSGFEQDTRTLRYTYQSLAQPEQVFDYDLETRQRTLRKVQQVPSGHDPADYVTRRIGAPAKDGASIPVSLLYRKDTPLDGTAPVWLYGYGAYGDVQHPEFGTERLSLVARGFVYAIGHARGGGEKGDAWHEAGRLGTKMNTFTDFIAVAEHLVALGITRPGRIVASGASAGGTLVGAVANLRPDLFGGIYADVAFVDVLNTLLDRTLPLTESSFSEFGNPIDSKAAFLTLQGYDPYENVRAQAYPPMLVTHSLNDTRVPYWESAKWVARLRHLKTGANPVLFLVKTRGGHGGGSGRFDTLEDFARAYAFGVRVLGDGGPAR